MSRASIILCARLPAIAKSIAEGLLPEFEAVNIYNTPEQALAAIPALLNAGNPGISQPASIVIGGGFSDADFDTIKLACKDKRRVPWFKADRSHFASMPPLSEPEAFGAKAAVRIKARLLELQVGQNTRESDEVFLF